ncbi:MAG: hypothetical protein E5Y00_36270, partial [Mesorhizobium sp.]
MLTPDPLERREMSPHLAFGRAHALPGNHRSAGCQERPSYAFVYRLDLELFCTELCLPARKPAFPEAEIKEGITGRIEHIERSIDDIHRDACTLPM